MWETLRRSFRPTLQEEQHELPNRCVLLTIPGKENLLNTSQIKKNKDRMTIENDEVNLKFFSKFEIFCYPTKIYATKIS